VTGYTEVGDLGTSAPQRGLVLINSVELTDATERPTTARHNFVSREYYVFMTPLVSSKTAHREGQVVQLLPRCGLTIDAKAFGQKPNALPRRWN